MESDLDDLGLVPEDGAQQWEPEHKHHKSHGHHGHHHHRDHHHPAGADIVTEEIPKQPLEKCQWYARRIVDNLFVRLLSIILVLTDAGIVLTRIVRNNGLSDQDKSPASYFSNCVVGYFLVEVALRIFAVGPRVFFRNPFDVFDFVIILTSAILEFAFDLASIVVLARLVRVVILSRILCEQRHIQRIIAMSFPSSGKEALFRNPIGEVVRFFNQKHPEHYWIYNLCSEREYDISKFSNRVTRLMIDDHNVPRLEDLIATCAHIDSFLRQDVKNVVAIHCKGGKGRTGTVVCAYLLYCGAKATAEESLSYFGARRSDLRISQQFQGVQTPSQARYVTYCSALLARRRQREGGQGRQGGTAALPLSIDVPAVRSLSVTVDCEGSRLFDSDAAIALGTATMSVGVGSVRNLTVPVVDFDLGALTVHGNVKIKFNGKGLPKYYDKCAFYFWFHTAFIGNHGDSLDSGDSHDSHDRPDRLFVPREQLDNPHKKKTWKYYGPSFGVELLFGDLDGEDSRTWSDGVEDSRPRVEESLPPRSAWGGDGSEEMVSMA